MVQIRHKVGDVVIESTREGNMWVARLMGDDRNIYGTDGSMYAAIGLCFIAASIYEDDWFETDEWNKQAYRASLNLPQGQE